MPDREKVIKGLQEIVNSDWMWKKADYWALICKNALALLEEQEPVRVGKKIKAGDVVLDFYTCGHCKNAIRKPWRYCPFCGRTVKWDAED